MQDIHTASIFIADDDTFCCSLYREHLGQSGFCNVSSFYSGDALLRNLNKNPELILLDYHLGDMNGSELYGKIKGVCPDAFIVIVSGQQDINLAVDMLNAGAFDYVFKDGDETKRLTTVLGKWMAAREYRRTMDQESGKSYTEKCLNMLAQAQEKIRKEIAFELHDNINQLLGTSMLFLRSAAETGQQQNLMIRESVKVIDMAINAIRSMSHSLQFAYMKKEDFFTKLNELLHTLRLQQKFTVNTRIALPDEGAAISPAAQHHLLRVLQEQLNNIIKYAEATSLTVTLEYHNGSLVMTTADNGKGFAASAKAGGIGIKHIRNRVEAMCGECILDTAPGKGCTWTLKIPLLHTGAMSAA